MELVDKFTPQDWYKGQRDAIRNAIQDTDSNWYKLIMNLYQLDPGVRKVIFPELYCKCQLKREVQDRKRLLHRNNCNVPWAILLDPTSACNLHCTGCWASRVWSQAEPGIWRPLTPLSDRVKSLVFTCNIYTGGETYCT